jgi:hypothetical protein
MALTTSSDSIPSIRALARAEDDDDADKDDDDDEDDGGGGSNGGGASPNEAGVVDVDVDDNAAVGGGGRSAAISISVGSMAESSMLCWEAGCPARGADDDEDDDDDDDEGGGVREKRSAFRRLTPLCEWASADAADMLAAPDGGGRGSGGADMT